jgi:adenylate kinase family enzyme
VVPRWSTLALGSMKIIVFGNSGSGKSTYARALSAHDGIPHLDLDSIVWEPGKVGVLRAQEAITASLHEFLDANAAWVMEGCYGELVQMASTSCTQLVFLNPGLNVCLANNRNRPWEPHKYTSRERQDSMLVTLQAWAIAYYQRDDQWSYTAHRRIFEAFGGSKVEYSDASAYSA